MFPSGLLSGIDINGPEKYCAVAFQLIYLVLCTLALHIGNYYSYAEEDSKGFGCFLDVCKDFDMVWIDGLLFKLFSELGIKGRMWLLYVH